ncbi:VOC family protein [Ornithinibacillus halotolerans]|uniref:Glyoxalase-like domain-containing protein n=1 Tax=Ornithinibacillus halotolerans TaxID=1274357 RepID=A0A916S7F1_9BACI|nr:VOC family protein [Ornithinibacillus halotolerans]GGA84377.1 hypothetical protein GCM10008025_29370 [Ornithinibacillus halotolerans]
MLSLDHIVIAGKDAEEDSITYNKQLAIKAVKGGEHENWGTYNYLAYFSNESYIEWLGIQDYDKAKSSNNPLIQHLVHILDQDKKGPFQFALRTNQMDEYVTHFQENDIPFLGPFPGKRKKSDGTLISWRMLFPVYNYHKEMLPFLIQWDDTESNLMSKGLLNPQAIMKIYYNGVDKDTFNKIYRLKDKKSLLNQFSLSNSKIVFTDKEKFSFELL